MLNNGPVERWIVPCATKDGKMKPLIDVGIFIHCYIYERWDIPLLITKRPETLWLYDGNDVGVGQICVILRYRQWNVEKSVHRNHTETKHTGNSGLCVISVMVDEACSTNLNTYTGAYFRVVENKRVPLCLGVVWYSKNIDDFCMLWKTQNRLFTCSQRRLLNQRIDLQVNSLYSC